MDYQKKLILQSLLFNTDISTSADARQDSILQTNSNTHAKSNINHCHSTTKKNHIKTKSPDKQKQNTQSSKNHVEKQKYIQINKIKNQVLNSALNNKKIQQSSKSQIINHHNPKINDLLKNKNKNKIPIKTSDPTKNKSKKIIKPKIKVSNIKPSINHPNIQEMRNHYIQLKQRFHTLNKQFKKPTLNNNKSELFESDQSLVDQMNIFNESLMSFQSKRNSTSEFLLSKKHSIYQSSQNIVYFHLDDEELRYLSFLKQIELKQKNLCKINKLKSEVSAVIKIQKIFRGYLTRKIFQNNYSSQNEYQEIEPPNSPIINSNDKLLTNSQQQSNSQIQSQDQINLARIESQSDNDIEDIIKQQKTYWERFLELTDSIEENGNIQLKELKKLLKLNIQGLNSKIPGSPISIPPFSINLNSLEQNHQFHAPRKIRKESSGSNIKLTSKDFLISKQINDLEQFSKEVIEAKKNKKEKMVNTQFIEKKINHEQYKDKKHKITQWYNNQMKNLNLFCGIAENIQVSTGQLLKAVNQDMIYLGKNFQFHYSFSEDNLLVNFSKINKIQPQLDNNVVFQPKEKQSKQILNTSPSPSPKYDDIQKRFFRHIKITINEEECQDFPNPPELPANDSQHFNKFSNFLNEELIENIFTSILEEEMVEISHITKCNNNVMVNAVIDLKSSIHSLKKQLSSIISYLEITYCEELIEKFNKLNSFNPNETLLLIKNNEIYSQIPKLLNNQIYNQFIEHIKSDKEIDDYQQCYIKVLFDGLDCALILKKQNIENWINLPWKIPRNLTINTLDQINIRQYLSESIDLLIRWTQNYAGFLPDKIFGNNPILLYQNQQYITQIQTDRLNDMLSNSVYEEEPQWTNYDIESTQIGIELAEIVFQYLLEEISNELISK